MASLQDSLNHIEECRKEARILARSDKLGNLLANLFSLMQSVLIMGPTAESLPLKIKALSMECEAVMREDELNSQFNNWLSPADSNEGSPVDAQPADNIENDEPMEEVDASLEENVPLGGTMEEEETPQDASITDGNETEKSIDESDTPTFPGGLDDSEKGDVLQDGTIEVEESSRAASVVDQTEPLPVVKEASVEDIVEQDDSMDDKHQPGEASMTAEIQTRKFKAKRQKRSHSRGGKPTKNDQKKQLLEVCTDIESTDESSNEYEESQINASNKTDEEQKCMICRTPTKHAHMRIVSCRACAVFYKRTIKMNCFLHCINGDENCFNGDKITSCRKCRFDRFKEIYDRASADEIPVEYQNRPKEDYSKKYEAPTMISSSLLSLQSTESPAFIDHTSTFTCGQRRSETPILDKMKNAYSSLCLMRRMGEMSALHHLLMHVQLQEEKMLFLAKSNFQLIQSLDGSYRGTHNFPNDDTVMATYATYVSDETLVHFIDDCPYNVNKPEAVELFRKNMLETTKNAKQEMRKINPSIDEFVALFGLALWNDYAFEFDEDISKRLHKNRQAILKELTAVYVRRGTTEYATRMGDLLCVLANEERAVDLTKRHVKTYRKMNLFNEAYEDEND